MAGLDGLDLGKQIGPLPLGAWAVALAGGLGIAFYSRRNSANTDDTIYADDTSSVPGVGVGGVGAFSQTDGGVATLSPATITSNTQWGQQAFNFLVTGGAAADVADRAVRNYLSGIPLNISENAMIALALAKYGQPPEPLPDAPAIPVVTPTPVATPAPPPVPVYVPPPPQPPAPVYVPPPPAERTYTVQRGDSLSRIAARFPEPWITWQSLYNANRDRISNPNLIYAGQVLRIA